MDGDGLRPVGAGVVHVQFRRLVFDGVGIEHMEATARWRRSGEMGIEIPGVEPPLQHDAGDLAVEFGRENDLDVAGGVGVGVHPAMPGDVSRRGDLHVIEPLGHGQLEPAIGVGEGLKRRRAGFRAAEFDQRVADAAGVEGVDHHAAEEDRCSAGKVRVVGEPGRIADLHQNMAEAVPDRGSPDHEHGIADGPAAANDTVRPDLRDLRIAGGKDRGVHVAAQGERNPLLELASGEADGARLNLPVAIVWRGIRHEGTSTGAETPPP